MENSTTLFNNIVAKCIDVILPKVSYIVSREVSESISDSDIKKKYMEKIKIQIEDMVKINVGNLLPESLDLKEGITNTCISMIMCLVKQNTKDQLINICIKHTMSHVGKIIDTEFVKTINTIISKKPSNIVSWDINNLCQSTFEPLIRDIIKIEMDKLLSKLTDTVDEYQNINDICIDRINNMVKEKINDKISRMFNVSAISEYNIYPYIISLYDDCYINYNWKVSKEHRKYQYHIMKKKHEAVLTEMLDDEDFIEQNIFIEFFKNVKPNEYVIYMNVEYSKEKIRYLLAITNFGSVYYRYHFGILHKFIGIYEIPKVLMDILIDNIMQNIKKPGTNLDKLFDNFIDAVESLQILKETNNKKQIQPHTI